MPDPNEVLGANLPDDYDAYLRTETPRGAPLLTIEQVRAHAATRTRGAFPFTSNDARRVLAARARGEDAFLEPDDTVGGVLAIADGGCDDLTLMVLAGELRGTIWASTDRGFVPHARKDGTLLGFREWLETVADAPPAKKRKKKTSKKKPAPVVIDRAAIQLNLRNKGLTELPEAVAEMSAVRMIYLGGNALTSLPASFARLASTVLALEIGPNPLGELPGFLERFEKLNVLDVKETGIRSLPPSIAKLPLRELYLDGNPELDVAQALSVAATIPTLRWLSLSRCALTELPDAIATMTNLERLYLGSNELTALPDALSGLRLELLGLIDNQIERLPDALETRVKTVYFAGNPGARSEKKRFDAVRKTFVAL